MYIECNLYKDKTWTKANSSATYDEGKSVEHRLWINKILWLNLSNHHKCKDHKKFAIKRQNHAMFWKEKKNLYDVNKRG